MLRPAAASADLARRISPLLARWRRAPCWVRSTEAEAPVTDLCSSYAALSSEAVRRAKPKRPHSGVHLTTRRTRSRRLLLQSRRAACSCEVLAPPRDLLRSDAKQDRLGERRLVPVAGAHSPEFALEHAEQEGACTLLLLTAG